MEMRGRGRLACDLRLLIVDCWPLTVWLWVRPLSLPILTFHTQGLPFLVSAMPAFAACEFLPSFVMVLPSRSIIPTGFGSKVNSRSSIGAPACVMAVGCWVDGSTGPSGDGGGGGWVACQLIGSLACHRMPEGVYLHAVS